MNSTHIYAALILRIARSSSDLDEQLNVMTADIISKYFYEYECIAYISEGGGGSIIPNSTAVTANINSARKYPFASGLLVKMYEMDCKGFVVRISKNKRSRVATELVNAFKKSAFSRYNNQRYLFLPVDKHDNDSSFLNLSIMYFMPWVIFVAPKPNSSISFDLLTHNYFNGHIYDGLNDKQRVMDVWYPESGFEGRESLYPDWLTNLNGKEIIFAVTNYTPYSLVIWDGRNFEYDGLELRIAAEFVERKNGTWKAKDHPIALWGEIFKNGSANGITGSVIAHKADMGFAAIYQWHCDIHDCSYPYILAGITCLSPKPKLLSGWYTIILPFEYHVWISVFITYLGCSLFSFYASVAMQKIKASKAASRSSLFGLALGTFFNTFRLQLEQTPRGLSNKPSFVFFQAWTIYCFFMAVLWRGGIASFLTAPRYEDPINTIHDLIQRWPRMKWGGNHIDWITSIEQTSEPDMQQIVRDFVVLNEDVLRQKAKTGDFSFFMERLPNGHYGLSDYLDEEEVSYLRIMESNIYTANCVIILPKCSPYRESLDKMLFWMFDTGLIQKLEIQVSIERINNRLQHMIRRSTEKEGHQTVVLQIGHIEGAIFIFAAGMTFSILVFSAELYYRFFKNSKTEQTN